MKGWRRFEEHAGEPDIQLNGLKIWVHGRERDSEDYWDGNWLRVTAKYGDDSSEVWTSGSIIHLSELLGWAESAERMNTTLAGAANLECMEPELSVELMIGKLGSIAMTVSICPDNRSQNHSFSSEIDQSYLPGLIRGCRAVLEKYPIRSAP